jgi:hypothetical protein
LDSELDGKLNGGLNGRLNGKSAGHIDAKALFSLFDARGALPDAIVRHLNSCECCGRVFLGFLPLGPSDGLTEGGADSLAKGLTEGGAEGSGEPEICERDEAWEYAAYNLAYGDDRAGGGYRAGGAAVDCGEAGGYDRAGGEAGGEVGSDGEGWGKAASGGGSGGGGSAGSNGNGGMDAETAKYVLAADGEYQKTYLRILGESSEYAKKRLAKAAALIERLPEPLPESLPEAKKGALGARLNSFFSCVACVAAGLVPAVESFAASPDFSALVPAGQFRALAATAAPDAPRQYIAEGRLPNGSAYKLSYQPFATVLEIDAFRPEPPRVLYYRANGDQTAFGQHSAAWTSVKSGKWTMKLSPDHPAIVALPEWNYVILAQSYKSLGGTVAR